MQLCDLVDPAALAAAVDAKYVKVQTHPTHDLRILNYTDSCMWDRAWNDTTMTCRGLIVDGEDRVVARGFRKFFNHSEPGADPISLTEPVEVTDKVDGSLGIIHETPAGWAVATRGSFASEQADHATALYRARFANQWTPPAGFTFLVEIVYGGNRIVIDYGDTDDLFLLAAVHTDTGAVHGPLSDVCAGWPGSRTQVQTHRTLTDALAATPRPNAEGLVVRSLTTGNMQKIKQDDYIQLHRLLTGFTARRLWERASVHAVLADTPDMPGKRIAHTLHLDPADVDQIVTAGPDWADDIRKRAPEEFTDWIDTTLARFRAQVADIAREVAVASAAVSTLLRKDAAAAISGHRYRGLIFHALDGRPITAGVWAAVRPAHELPFRTVSEDVA